MSQIELNWYYVHVDKLHMAMFAIAKIWRVVGSTQCQLLEEVVGAGMWYSDKQKTRMNEFIMKHWTAAHLMNYFGT